MVLSKYAKKKRGQLICRKKLQYNTRGSAWNASLYYFTTYGFFNTTYRCRHCKLFHLTSKHIGTVPPSYLEGLADWFGIPVEDFKVIIYERKELPDKV